MAEREQVTRVHVTAPTIEALREVLREHPFPVAGGVRHGPNGQAGIDAYVTAEELATLRGLPVSVEVVADATAVGRERQAQVGRGNRFSDPAVVPRGLGELRGGEQ
jgi:hypothetical protein